MKKLQLFLALSCSMIIGTHANAALNQENKDLLMNLAKGYTTYGLAGLGIGTLLSKGALVTETTATVAPPLIRNIGKGLAQGGVIALSPIRSVIATACMPISIPIYSFLTKKGIYPTNLPESSIFNNSKVRPFYPTVGTPKYVFRIPLPAIVGFGAPLAWQKYQQAQQA